MKLTPDEEKVFFNTDFIQTKRLVAEKVIGDLSVFKNELSELIKVLDSTHFIHQFLYNFPKISRGENYHGLPYFILDYPRVFEQKNTFAIRTMIYWGNFFSFTLQLSGNNQKVFSKIISEETESFSDYYICVNDSPWEHHFRKDNYQIIRSLSKNEFIEILHNKPFLKLSIQYPLAEYSNLHKYGLLFYQKIISLLS